mgnify:CR=1 FL=1
MNKKLLTAAWLCGLFVIIVSYNTKDINFVKENFSYARTQITHMLNNMSPDENDFPRTINKNGNLIGTNMYDWTSGFFPGSLWYVYDYTQDAAIKQAAIKWTEKLAPLQNFTDNHDLGFMMYCSYGNAYRITGNQLYKDILIQSANSLATRFNSVTGSIKSWNRFKSWHGNKTYYFPVIIDNMMNLELLFFASKVTGDDKYRKIAISHASQTMKNQIRKDYSSFHVVCYDSVKGNVIGRETAQGYSDNSTWSRGQAWGIYGFTMVYRETKDNKFLKTATGMADYYLNNSKLPVDKIPYWDFNANQNGYKPGSLSYANKINFMYRDASAAAITASALFELANYVPSKRKKYLKAAIDILKSLSGNVYKAPVNSNGNFLLMHSVGSIPHQNEIDVPLVYADYYFLEALSRYNKILLNDK